MTEKAYEAKLKSSHEDCRPPSELEKDTPKRTFQRDLEPKKPKVQSAEPVEDAKVRAKTATEKRLAERWPELAKITPAAEPEYYGDAMLRGLGMFPDRSQLAGSAKSRSNSQPTYHVRAPLAMSSSSSPSPTVVPPEGSTGNADIGSPQAV